MSRRTEDERRLFGAAMPRVASGSQRTEFSSALRCLDKGTPLALGLACSRFQLREAEANQHFRSWALTGPVVDMRSQPPLTLAV